MFLLQQPADGTEERGEDLRCHDPNNREAGFPVFYRCCAPGLPIGDGFAGYDEERGLGITKVDL
jgi:hypothetical protein